MLEHIFIFIAYVHEKIKPFKKAICKYMMVVQLSKYYRMQNNKDISEK